MSDARDGRRPSIQRISFGAGNKSEIHAILDGRGVVGIAVSR